MFQEDLSIVGYNDIELIHYLDIPLDTIAESQGRSDYQCG